jgi:uracil-DNA glycosylase family 4
VDDFLRSLESRGINIVESTGPPSDLAIIGEAPGENEDKTKILFSGPAGHSLDGFFRSAGIDRRNTFITNVVCARPPGNNLSRLIEYGLSVEDFKPSLKNRLERYRPKCVLALGATALEALTGKTGIFDQRGSILESTLVPGLKVIPTIHPAALLRMADDSSKSVITSSKGAIKWDYGTTRIAMTLDFRRAKEESRYADLRLPVRNLNYDSIVRAIGQIAPAPYVAFDIETAGTTITHLGLAPSSDYAVSIPLTSLDVTTDQRVKVIEMVRTLLLNHRGLIAQNAQFDMTLLLQLAPLGMCHFDTMLAHHRIYPELPHSLSFLVSVYTREPFYKSNEDYAVRKPIVNAKDAACTWEIMEKLKKELKEFNQENEFYGFVMPLMHTVLRMMWRGVKADTAKLEEVRVELEKQLEVRKAVLDGQVGSSLNVNSPKQMKEYLYGTLGLPEQRHHKTAKSTTDEQAIEKLYTKSQNPILRSILELRETSKLLGTYAKASIDIDGRVRTSYNVSGTDTGRLSSRKTVYNTGMNLQNQPPTFRKVFVPDENLLLLEADLKQAEALLVAHFSQDPTMMKAFASGTDIHKWNASKIFEKSVETITKSERYLAKRMVHALNYGLGPIQFMNHVNGESTKTGVSLTAADSKRLIDIYFKTFPNIKEWHRWIENEVEKTRILVNPFGRQRMFFGRLGPDLFRKAYAYLPQSTCVDYLNYGMVRVEQRLPLEASLLLQVHDSMVIQCPKDQQDQVIKIVREELSVPITIHNRQITIGVEIKTSPTSWGEMKEVV